jgi:hypothetical protein
MTELERIAGLAMTLMSWRSFYAMTLKGGRSSRNDVEEEGIIAHGNDVGIGIAFRNDIKGWTIAFRMTSKEWHSLFVIFDYTRYCIDS